MRAIDFFCGGGGISRGLTNAGIEVLAGVDICAEYQRTYDENNNGVFITKSITDIERKDIERIIPDVFEADDVLFAGCAPCQPFSKQRKSNTIHRDRNLLTAFGRLISEFHPAYVLVENVPGIKSSGKDVFTAFLATLEQEHYLFKYDVLNAMNYGVPQNRKRLVLIASRIVEPRLPEPSCDGSEDRPFATVRDAIANFPRIEAGEVFDGIPNHKAAHLSEINMRRIRLTPHDGGSRTSWPDELVLTCHRSAKAGHTDVYGRMAWDSVSPTLTSKCCSISNGRFGHPEQDRAISFREAAALQSFPDDYVFYGNSDAVIGREIGNAVPVLLAEALGHTLIEMEEEFNQVAD